MGQKLGTLPFGGGELDPHLTQCGQGRGLLARMPSFISIHLTVWPQYTNVADRQDRQTERTDRTDRQRSDSI